VESAVPNKLGVSPGTGDALGVVAVQVSAVNTAPEAVVKLQESEYVLALPAYPFITCTDVTDTKPRFFTDFSVKATLVAVAMVGLSRKITQPQSGMTDNSGLY
jgi:hypothetical protein